MAHICWVIRDLRGGGAERMVIAAANGLCERGHQVDLVQFFPANDYPGDVLEQVSVFVLSRRPGKWSRIRQQAANLFRKERKHYRNIEAIQRTEWCIRRLPLGKLPGLLFRLAKEAGWPLRDLMRRQRRADFVRALRLGHYLEERKPDVVFTNLWQANLAGFFASRMMCECPTIVPVAHCTVERQRTGHFDLLRLVFPAVSNVVAVSRGVAENYVAAVGIPADRITTIYNPAVTPVITQMATKIPDHLWFRDGGPPIVLGVGRLTPQKDFLTLLEAFRQVLVKRSFRLVILGEVPMRSELESRIRTLGLQEQVSLPGWADNPYACMSNAALFVFSSRYEGFGNVLAEALACGCPAVSTDCPSGPSEILEDPTLLAPVGEPEALAGVMLRALAEPPDKVALRARAERFSTDEAVKGYDQVILDIVSSHGGKCEANDPGNIVEA